MYSVKILKDSLAESDTGTTRLTTMEVTFPRYILAEFNTHRVLSRNSASSRAIPISKRIAAVKEQPFVPSNVGRNKRGMQSEEALTDSDQAEFIKIWLEARDAAVQQAEKLEKLGAHKQWTNRILEPYLWHTAIVSATEWSNFFHLRIHKDAQPEIKEIAEMMDSALQDSNPDILSAGQWHLPFIDERDSHLSIRQKIKCSVARCARVSYETHDSGKRDEEADFRLHDSLVSAGHMSPTEHIAQVAAAEPTTARIDYGNFKHPFIQYRKMIPNEWDVLGAK